MFAVCAPIRFTQVPPPAQLRFWASLGLGKCGSWSATLLKWSATRATFGKHWSTALYCHTVQD